MIFQPGKSNVKQIAKNINVKYIEASFADLKSIYKSIQDINNTFINLEKEKSEDCYLFKQFFKDMYIPLIHKYLYSRERVSYLIQSIELYLLYK